MTKPIPSPVVDLTEPNFAETLAMLGVTGQATYAPLGTPVPVGLDKLAAPAVNLGWFSDEGLTEQITEEKAEFTPWQTDSAIRTSTTKKEFTFGFTLWTIGGLANAMRYGVPVDRMKWVEEGEYVEFTQGGEQLPDFRMQLTFDVVDGVKHRRFFLPNASVQEPAEVVYKKDEMVAYGFTVRANLSGEHGYSILRRFKEGWKPGTQGSTLEAGKGVRDYGDWSADVNADTSGDSGGTA